MAALGTVDAVVLAEVDGELPLTGDAHRVMRIAPGGFGRCAALAVVWQATRPRSWICEDGGGSRFGLKVSHAQHYARREYIC